MKNYPFSAIVAQERMKIALIVNLIDPAIGGVLIRGAKGTAKSTAVRSLEDILPSRKTAVGCPFNCTEGGKLCDACKEKLESGTLHFHETPMRVVELPINATQDRVAGSINIEKALKSAEKTLEPGILAYANRNILYIDEVNLLSDHVVDIILDAAAMGVHHVEREGISVSHPSRFVLIGTMNPEEGELRPQLLDRFGLVVDVRSEQDSNKRIQLMERRLAFEEDPEGFSKTFETEQQALRERLTHAKEKLPNVRYEHRILEAVAQTAIALELEGHRAEITAIKTAKALAAWKNEDSITDDILLEALGFVLPHRLRRLPFEKSIDTQEQLLELLKEKQCYPFAP